MRALDLRHSAHADTFAQRLRRARQHCGLTVDDLGAKVSMLPRRVQKYEDGGAAPARHDIDRLARACGVEPMWLMAGDLAGKKFAPVWEGGKR
ncbi:helix-turn-helix domain-containing protein [Dyella sp.]|uniref:helix-turn-helix domain-containing protein n=1 Tax=Dyella sp. TaxID=1869338 RepID=UPI003F7E8477